MSDETFEVTCPCCQTKLTLDADNGAILLEDRPKKPRADWNDVIEAGNSKKAAAERLFRQNMDRERNVDQVLDKKFKEALKRAGDSPDPPRNIFDLD